MTLDSKKVSKNLGKGRDGVGRLLGCWGRLLKRSPFWGDLFVGFLRGGCSRGGVTGEP